jgi:hypothetical protein
VAAKLAAPAVNPSEQAEVQQTPAKPLDVRTVTFPLTALVRAEVKTKVVPSPVLGTSVSTTNQLAVQPQVVAAQGLLPNRPADPRRRTEALPELARAMPKAEGFRFAPFELPAFRAHPQPQPLGFGEIVAPQPALPVTHAAPSPAPVIHDFAALIDRIVAAREASAAPVALAVRHAEFGPVTLRFEQGDSGLTVAATSPDPDFARAAAAALPTDRPAIADSAPRDGGKASAQQETANSNGGGSGHARQQSGTTQTRSASRQTHSASTTEDHDSGIFA